MPLYEYQCDKCGKRVERIEKMNGPHLKTCPSCRGRMSRLLSAPAIQFKGSGWYVTDYAKSSSGGDSHAGAGATSGAGTDTKSENKADSSKESTTKDKDAKKPAAKPAKEK